MASFVVLEAWQGQGASFAEAEIIDSDRLDAPVSAYQAAGLAVLAYVPATMDAPLERYRRTRPRGASLLALFADAGVLGGGGGGSVVSVFGRVGAVVAAAGDYDASEVGNDSSVTGADVAAALDALDAAKPNAGDVVLRSDYSPAHSVLVQQSGTGSPTAAAIGTNELLGRLSGGGAAIEGLTAAQVRGVLNVEDGADVTDAANVEAAGAIMSAVDGQIAALAAKASPTAADLLLIEDAAASNGKRRITIGDLPSSGGPTIDGAATGAGPVTINLPALPAVGTRRIVQDQGGQASVNAVTIVPNGSDTIEGEPRIFLLTNGASVTLISDGTQWRIESWSTGAPPYAGITDLDASNTYAGGVGDLPGATSMLAETVYLPTLESSDPSIFGNLQPATPVGYRFFQDAAFVGFEFQSSTPGGPYQVTSAVAGLNPRQFGRHPMHLFATLEVIGGTDTRASFYADGLLMAQTDFAGVLLAPATATAPAFGATTFSTALGDGVVLGASYEEAPASIPTPADVAARFLEIRTAGRIVAGTLDPAHRYDAADVADLGATWTDRGRVGGVPLTLTGSPSRYRSAIW